jgi:hypothetical protein
MVKIKVKCLVNGGSQETLAGVHACFVTLVLSFFSKNAKMKLGFETCC